MRFLILPLAGVLLFSGCAKVKSWLPSGPKSDSSATTSSTTPAITPATSDSGKVAMVNTKGRFVVMTFPPGGVPPLHRQLNVYRNGVKVAEVKVTGPQRDNNTVADILSGEAERNDDVRAD